MKNKKFFMLLLAALFALCFAPGVARADDDDFDVSFNFYPHEMGYNGGNAVFSLTVANNGETDITWLDVVINTSATYSHRFTGNIEPDSQRSLEFSVPLTGSDLGKTRILQVAMNNNSTANPDGLKMMNFQIGKITDIFDITCTINPARTVYHPGDTVTVSLSFTNNVETHAAVDLRSIISMQRGSWHIYDGTEASHGNVDPGQTATTSFRYTFTDDDVGHIMVNRVLRFTLMDKLYAESGIEKEFDVQALRPEFSASLYADPTTIGAGEDVTFRIAVGNTGEGAIDRFEVTDLGGATVAEAEGLPAGGSGSVTFTAPVNESGAVSYVVIGIIGTESRSLETNMVPITVRESAAEASASGSSPAESGAPAGPSGSASPAATTTHSGTSPASPSGTQEALAAAGELSAQNAQEASSAESPLPAVLIAVIAAAAAVIAFLLVLLKKRKKNRQ